MLAVAATTEDGLTQAREWGHRLSLPLIETPLSEPKRYREATLLLVCSPEGLYLQQTGRDAPGPVYVDWRSGKSDHRRRQGGGNGQLVAKAVGIARASRPLRVVDATAGLGEDAFVMATLGAQVTLLERSPVMAALLADGMARAEADPELAPIVARMTLVETSATEWLAEHRNWADVVYLDPMFPGRGKSALVKKEMRVCRGVVGDDPDADQLLEAALGAAACRVVVKRPRKAPRVSEREPAAQLAGRSSRFDLYTWRALP